MPDTSTTTALATVSPLNAAVLAAFDEAQAALAATETRELLRKAYALTHQIHGARQGSSEKPLHQYVRDLRGMRDMIDAEILRRTDGAA